MTNKKRLLFLMVLALALAVAALAWLAFRPATEKPVYGEELLANGGFEAVTGEDLPEGWLPESYLNDPDLTSFRLAGGKEGGGIEIESRFPNDARFYQTVSVEPDAVYRFSGYVRASAEGGAGANLSVSGIYVFSEPVFETGDEWEYVELYGKTGKGQREVTLFARLGGYSSESSGSAAFDDLSLVRVEAAPPDAAVPGWEAPRSEEPKPAGREAGPAAPWLLGWMLLFALIMAYFAKSAERAEQRSLNESPSRHGGLALLLVLALFSRLAVAVLAPGFPVDVGSFSAWANRMAEVGPGRFYAAGYFSDYPPGYMLVLWPLGWLGRLLGTGTTETMVKLPSILCDLGVVWLLYRAAEKRVSRKAAAWLAALYAFNPLTFLAGAAWGQADSVPSLLLLLCVLFIIDGRWRIALPVYVLAVLMKPQALMAGPLGLMAFIMDVRWLKKDFRWKDFLLGVLGAVLVALAVSLPFFNGETGFSWLVGLYANTMGQYDYATVNAANLFFLFGKNWVPVSEAAPFLLRLTGFVTLALPVALVCQGKGFQPVGQESAKRWKTRLPFLAALVPALAALMPMSHAALGALLMVSAFALAAAAYAAGGNAGNLPLLGGVLLTVFSLTGTMMHERYLFLGMALLALAYVRRRDARLLWLLIAVSALGFLNSGVVLDRGVRIAGGAANLSAPAVGLVSDSAWLEYALSALSLPVAAFAVYTGLALSRPEPLVHPVRPLPERAGEDRFAFLSREAKPVRFGGKDALLVLLVTALYAVLALVNLGATAAPQTAWVAYPGDRPALLDLGEPRRFSLYFYGGIHWENSGFTVEVSDDQENWAPQDGILSYGDCFAWRALQPFRVEDNGVVTRYGASYVMEGRYVRLSVQSGKVTMLEVAAVDAETGKVLPFAGLDAGGELLSDEQAVFGGKPTWFNSMYFDEIYHGRTAFEQRNALTGREPSAIYETSHPPLGKLLMTFSVMLFGMTPFGWRFAGALAGVLMLPGMYLLGKQLTGRKFFGLAAMLLMAFDFMHFTQTRIATIDSFVTLFIIYAYFFMFRWMAEGRFTRPMRKRLPPLALSGLMTGLAIASKWTGVYAGIGLAVLFFWTLVKDARRGYACGKMRAAVRDTLTPEVRERADACARGWPRESVATLLWCAFFFIVVPLAIYYASYYPVFAATPGGLTLRKVIDANVGMYNYHSASGLGADHAFASPWYEWPLSVKPIYFYAGGVENGTASSILSFGNPAVWWTGLAALILTALTALRQWIPHGKSPGAEGEIPPAAPGDPRPMMLLISFAAQFLPWLLVPRGTYIYHYFPSVPFIILCAVTMLFYWSRVKPKAARRVTVALCALAAALFVVFFPYLSGVRVSTAWLQAMQWFPNWLYF